MSFPASSPGNDHGSCNEKIALSARIGAKRPNKISFATKRLGIQDLACPSRPRLAKYVPQPSPIALLQPCRRTRAYLDFHQCTRPSISLPPPSVNSLRGTARQFLRRTRNMEDHWYRSATLPLPLSSRRARRKRGDDVNRKPRALFLAMKPPQVRILLASNATRTKASCRGASAMELAVTISTCALCSHVLGLTTSPSVCKRDSDAAGHVLVCLLGR